MSDEPNDQSYHPLCQPCEEDGDITLATGELECLGERYPACQAHIDKANERWISREEEARAS